MRFVSFTSVRLVGLVRVVIGALSLVAAACVPAAAQQRPLHYFHSADLPPGAIGSGQVLRGGPTRCYFQPVEIRVPRGVLISPAVNGQFAEPQADGVLVGLQIGPVYRFKVAGIPDHETDEVYPTVEVISRLHPPPGQAARFPIPIDVTREEIEMALSGRFVTRVIYLEDPNNALPLAEDPAQQRYFEVRPGQDPLRVADELGRPMAILRMGSRIPDPARETTNLGYQYGTPPLMLLEKQAQKQLPRDAGLEQPAQPPVPRTSGNPNN